MASGSRVLAQPTMNAKAVKEMEKKKKLPNSALLQEENKAYEDRLASLKAQMELEKEKRNAIKKTKEGTRWRSAKPTAPLRNYADNVLDRARARSSQNQNRPPSNGVLREDLEPLTKEDAKTLYSPKKSSPGKDNKDQPGYALFFNKNSAKIVLENPELGEVPGLSNKKTSETNTTTKASSFHEQAMLSAITEESLGGSTKGGSLLDGSYDEAANANAFQQALKDWRQGGGGGAVAGSAVTPRNPREEQEQSLLDGTYDEIANANAFQEALEAWRNPRPVEPVQVTDMSGGWRNPFGPPDDLVAPGETQTNAPEVKQAFKSCYQCYKTFVEDSGFYSGSWDKLFCTEGCAVRYGQVTKVKCVHFDVCKIAFLKEDAVSVKGTLYCSLDCAGGNPKSPQEATDGGAGYTPRTLAGAQRGRDVDVVMEVREMNKPDDEEDEEGGPSRYAMASQVKTTKTLDFEDGSDSDSDSLPDPYALAAKLAEKVKTGETEDPYFERDDYDDFY